MDLRRKLLIIVGLTLLCTLIAFYAVTNGIILGAFVTLEEKNTQQNMNRFQNLLAEDLSSLDAVVRAWAPRDDTYTFMRDRDPAFIERNFGPDTFSSGRINFVVFLNTSGALFYAKAFDLATGQEGPLPGNIADMVAGNQEFWNFTENRENRSGFLLLPEGPVMVATAPITTKNYDSVSNGKLIVGRILDEGGIQRIALLTNQQVTVYRQSEPGSPADVRAAQAELDRGRAILIQPDGPAIIAGYAQVKDLRGDPILIIKTQLPREIYAQGQATLNYFTLSYILLVLVFAIVFLSLLDRSLLSPIAQLSSDVKKIGMTRDLSARLEVGKEENEVTNLQENINKTLSALEKAQVRLQRSEEKNRALLSAIPDLLCQLRREGIHEEWNAGTAAELGALALQELLGKDLRKIEETFQVIPQAGAGEGEKEAWEGEASPVFIFEYTTSGKGGVRYYEMRLVVSGEDEALAIVRDITDRKMSEEELGRYRAHLEEIVAARTGELQRTNEQLRQEIFQRKLMEAQKREAYEQIEKNIEQFAILGDHIRNPLAVIVGIADLTGGTASEKILQQAKAIDRIIDQLDRGWIESEKVREFLRRYYSNDKDAGK
ncbi:MAG TPA: CHASE4 domain-containing protein [Methanomicrobiales archaeon]|jgi:sensor domain CHASE-containing protein|nr:CHASE4 domain-containing protein [Methanomicrobiales archaeon]